MNNPTNVNYLPSGDGVHQSTTRADGQNYLETTKINGVCDAEDAAQLINSGNKNSSSLSLPGLYIESGSGESDDLLCGFNAIGDLSERSHSLSPL